MIYYWIWIKYFIKSKFLSKGRVAGLAKFARIVAVSMSKSIFESFFDSA